MDENGNPIANNDQGNGNGGGKAGDQGGDQGGNSGGQNQNANGGNGDGSQNNGGQNQPVQLTQEQLNAAFQHPRFKELSAAAQELKTLKENQTKADQKALEEQGKFKELAEQREAEAKQYQTQLETERKNNALINEAVKLGAHDASVVAKLADSGKITINEDGTVNGADDALKALQSAQPYLFKTGNQQNIGGGDTNPQSGNSGDSEYTYSQFKDAAFYKANQEKMDKALVAGKVDMTR